MAERMTLLRLPEKKESWRKIKGKKNPSARQSAAADKKKRRGKEGGGKLSTSVSRHSSSTIHFIILKPPNPSIVDSSLHDLRQSTDFTALKLPNVRSGLYSCCIIIVIIYLSRVYVLLLGKWGWGKEEASICLSVCLSVWMFVCSSFAWRMIMMIGRQRQQRQQQTWSLQLITLFLLSRSRHECWVDPYLCFCPAFARPNILRFQSIKISWLVDLM